MKKQKLTSIFQILLSRFGLQHWWPGDTPFEIAIGAILTQNTNWTNVEKAINNIKSRKKLAARRLRDLPVDQLSELIRPAGYFNIKGRRVKCFVDFLFTEYRGSMKIMKREDGDTLRDKLLGVHGIGQETADSILLYALEKPFFVIDAYTRRVLSRHSILGYNDSYRAFQMLFHSGFDRNVQLYNEFHALVVRLGKEYCRTKPLCEVCPVSGV